MQVILSKVVLAGTNVPSGLESLGPQTIRVINAGQKKIVPSPTKAITLAQARQMGLLSPGKLQQILPNTNIKVRPFTTPLTVPYMIFLIMYINNIMYVM